MPRHIGTCFRFYMQMRVEKKTKHLPIEFIVTSHNSACIDKILCFLLSMLIWPKILLILHPSVWNLTTHITIQYIVESIPHGLIVVESVEKKEKRKWAKRKDVLCFVSLFYHCTALLFPVAKVLRCHSNHAESRKVPK